jgi:Sigma-70 region 2
MLGSLSEADDAVQESWIRLSRSDTNGVESLGGWLTAVVARVCLDMLRSRKSRREEPLGAVGPEPIVRRESGIDPSKKRCWPIRSVSRCSWCSRRWLPPSGSRSCCTICSPFPSTRSLPSWGAPLARQAARDRARSRVQGAVTVPDDVTRQREVVDAFLAASRGGDFDALLAVLDPDVVLRADRAAVHAGASSEVRGAAAVADTFSGRARAAQPALVNGAVGLVWGPRGRPRAYSASRSRAARSSKSTWSPTTSASASSTWRSSTTDEPTYVAARVIFGSSGPDRSSTAPLLRLMREDRRLLNILT